MSTGWLAGTNVSDIIYDVKCSVPALTLPLLYLPLCVSGSGKHTCNSLINTLNSLWCKDIKKRVKSVYPATQILSFYPISKCEKTSSFELHTYSHQRVVKTRKSLHSELVSAAQKKGRCLISACKNPKHFRYVPPLAHKKQKHTPHVAQRALQQYTTQSVCDPPIRALCIFQADCCSVQPWEAASRGVFALWTGTLTIWQGHTQTHLLETANTPPPRHKVQRPRSALCDWKL